MLCEIVKRCEIANMTEKHGVSKKEVSRILSDAGYSKNLMKLSSREPLATHKNAPVLKGLLNFNQLPSGLNIHCADVVEEITGKNTSETFDGISINFLISGNINFALNEHSYQVSAEHSPITFINVLKEPALFTRFFNKGTVIRKLNISVSKAWLYARAQSSNDQCLLDTLFSHKQAVYQWRLTPDTGNLVTQLFQLQEQSDITSLFNAEHIAFQLFAQCYEQLSALNKPNITPLENNLLAKNVASNLYEKELERVIYDSLSLDELSLKLGASISTLQRYFKAKHQVTVKEYIRNQKLEHARRSLIFDHKSIGEVAYEAGYIHVSNFIIAFKKYFLMTPSELKTQHKRG